ncbi:unnamed protein product [Trichobilharzia regenti]|nr:unnamed protein product [Trichobilharzia regenti]
MTHYPLHNKPPLIQSEWDHASEVERIMCGSRPQEFSGNISGSHTLPRHYSGNYYHSQQQQQQQQQHHQREIQLNILRHHGINGAVGGSVGSGSGNVTAVGVNLSGSSGTVNKYDSIPQHKGNMYSWASPTNIRQFATTFHPSYQTSVSYDPSLLFPSSPSTSVCSDGRLYYRVQRLVQPTNESRYVLDTKTTLPTTAYPHNRNIMSNTIYNNILQISGLNDQPSIQQTSLNNHQTRTRLQYPSALVRTIVRMESSDPKDLYGNAYVREQQQKPQEHQQHQQQSSEIPPVLPVRMRRSATQKETVTTKRHLIPIPLDDRLHLDPYMTPLKDNTAINTSSYIDNKTNLPQSVLTQLYPKKNTFDLEGHLDCSCDYVRAEAGLWPADVWYARNFHTVDKCTCPHEEVHRFFDSAPSKWKLADTIAMLPIRETDILDDLIDSTSDEDESAHRSVTSVEMKTTAIPTIRTTAEMPTLTTEYYSHNRNVTPSINDAQSKAPSQISSNVQTDQSVYRTSVTCHHISGSSSSNSNNYNVSCDEDDLVPLGELLSSNTNLLNTISGLGRQSGGDNKEERTTSKTLRKPSFHNLQETKDRSISGRNSVHPSDEKQLIRDTPSTLVGTPSTPGSLFNMASINNSDINGNSIPEERSPKWKKTEVTGIEDDFYKTQIKPKSTNLERIESIRGDDYDTELDHRKDKTATYKLTGSDQINVEPDSQVSINDYQDEHMREKRKKSISPPVHCYPELDDHAYTGDKDNSFQSFQIDSVAQALDRLHWDMRTTLEGRFTDQSSTNADNKDRSSSQVITSKDDSYHRLSDEQSKNLHMNNNISSNRPDDGSHFHSRKEEDLMDSTSLQEGRYDEQDEDFNVDRHFLQPTKFTMKSDNGIHDHEDGDDGKQIQYEEILQADDDDDDAGGGESLMQENVEMDDSLQFKMNDQQHTDGSLSQISGQSNKIHKQKKAMERWSLIRTHVGKVGRQVSGMCQYIDFGH